MQPDLAHDIADGSDDTHLPETNDTTPGPEVEPDSAGLDSADLAESEDSAELADTTPNQPPSAPEVTVSPATPTTLDPLVAAVAVEANDPEGGALSYRFEWTRDGAVSGAGEAVIPAEATHRGERWRVVVRAFDGELEGPPGSAEVTIVNAAPGGGEAHLEPGDVHEGETLTCFAAGAEDPDGDVVDWLFMWWVDGVEVGVTTATLGDEHFERGQQVVCGATPTDGFAVGAAVRSGEVSVVNSAPALESAALAPAEVTRDAELFCSFAGWSDPDPADLAPQVGYAWWRTRDGETTGIEGASAATFVPSILMPGDEVGCEVTPLNPGLTPDRGASVRSGTSVIVNRLPVMAGVDLAPTNPRVDSVLTCTPVGASDADGDGLSFEFVWTRGGEVLAGAGADVLDEAFTKGDVIVCGATVRDAFGRGDTVFSASVMIENTPPAGGYVSVSPAMGVREGTTLTCQGAGASDLDGDALTWRYAWRVDGLEVSESTATLSSAHFDRGQSVVCTAAPFDGEEAGPPISSGPVTVENSAPGLVAATVTPAEVARSGLLTCNFSGWSDPDPADLEPEVSYAWFVGEPGAFIPIPGETSSTFAPSALQPGDRVSCAVTPLNSGLTPDRGTAVHSGTALIINRPPSLASVALAPPSPRVDSVLTCTPGLASDPDNDAVIFTYRWLRGSAPGTPISEATTSTLSDSFLKGEVIRCEATPRDPFGAGAPTLSPAVTIQNTAPTGGYATLSPASNVREGSTLTCAGSGASDLDDDPITWRYGWRIDGLESNVTTATLSSAHFDRGQSVVCTAAPFDGEEAGPPISSGPVTVENSAPGLVAATVTPAEVARSGLLTCNFSGWSDPDPADLEPEVSYAWFVGEPGAFIPIPGETSSTFAPSALQPGDRVSCAVTPLNSGLTPDRGTAVHSGTALIINRPPSLASVALAPPSPRVDSVLTCTPGLASDPDNDPVTFTYRWLRGSAPGTPISDATTSTLADSFLKGEVIRCEATARDPFGAGAPTLSPAVTIQNTAPTLSALTLTPASASPCATFVCTPGATFDPDTADTHTTTFRWTLDDLPVAHTAATWSPTDLTPGRRVRCHASTSDGTHSSPELSSNEVTTTNTPPSLTNVSLSPSPTVQLGSSLTCVPTGYSDPECAPTPSYTWRWYRNGAPLAAATATLSTSGLAVGDTVSCEATPRDQWSSGPARASNAVTVINDAPTTPVVLVTAINGTAGPITCELAVPSVDLEPLTYAWHWQIGDSPGFIGSQVLDQPTTDCDRVRCWVSVTDGHTTITSTTSELILPFGAGCDDGNTCTDDACAPSGGCQFLNHTRSCDDGDFCNGVEVCQDGEPIDCGGITDPCLQATCNPATGACDLPMPDGWPCPDADLCDGFETCLAGSCLSATPVECGAVTNPCLQTTCNPDTGACDLPQPDGTTCDDGDACSLNDACDSGTCVADSVCGCELTTGLLLWYDFESSLQDKSGNGRHATSIKLTSYVDTLFGKGLFFDGGQHLTVQNGKTLGPTASRSRTIAFWARPTVRGTAVMNQYENGNSHNSSFFIAPNGAPSWQVTGNGTNVLQGSIGPLDTWEHIAVVFAAGTDQTVIYRNGTEVARGSLNYSEAQSTRDTRIGEGLGLLGNFRGTLDELRVYDRALSASDIATLAAPTCEPPAPPCVCPAGLTGPDCSEPVTACGSLYLGDRLFHRAPLTGPVPTTIWIGFQAISKGIQNAGVIIDNARIHDIANASTPSLLFHDPFDTPSDWLTRSGAIGQAKVEGGQGFITADWGGFERTGNGTSVSNGHFSVQFDTYWGPNTDGVQIVIHRSNASLPTWNHAWLWAAIGMGDYATGDSDAAALFALEPGGQSPIIADSSTPIAQGPSTGWHVFELRIQPGDCEPPQAPSGLPTCEVPPPTGSGCPTGSTWEPAVGFCTTPWQTIPTFSGNQPCGPYYRVALPAPMNEFRPRANSQVFGGFLNATQGPTDQTTHWSFSPNGETAICNHLWGDDLGTWTGGIRRIAGTAESYCDNPATPPPLATHLMGCGIYSFSLEGRALLQPTP
ncbi:MAG TPA: hypothetical protein PK095_00965 [Myxococcota bacterium]|nr:hypothetical protein [Myxococcota bacterium]